MRIVAYVMAVVGILAFAHQGFPQPTDLAKILVGTWEGEIERVGADRSPRGAHFNHRSTLVIESLQISEGQAQGKGQLAIGEGPAVPAAVQARMDGGRVVVTVRNPRGVTAELSLSGESSLAGTVGGGGFGMAHPARFTKQK